MALRVLRELPQLIEMAERLVPGANKGQDRRVTVASEMVKYEGALALDQRVQAAKRTLIDAQVAYIKAMETAEQTARALGVPLPGCDEAGVVTTPKLLDLNGPRPPGGGDFASRAGELAAIGGPSS